MEELMIHNKKLQCERIELKHQIFDLQKQLSYFQTRHSYFKFDKTKPGLYVIINQTPNEEEFLAGKQYEVKIGICGYSKKKDKVYSIDKRLRSHRVLWPHLHICKLVYFDTYKKAELVEKVLKTAFVNESNPHGKEKFKISPIKLEEFIEKFIGLMSWKETVDFECETEYQIDKYNMTALTYNKDINDLDRFKYKI